MNEPIKGFSKLSKAAKLEWLTQNNFEHPDKTIELFQSYWHNDSSVQQKHDDFIENTMTNYYMLFGVASNAKLMESFYTLPMAIEESSVVAAAAKSASFWLQRGGFKTEVISTEKIGCCSFHV